VRIQVPTNVAFVQAFPAEPSLNRFFSYKKLEGPFRSAFSHSPPPSARRFISWSRVPPPFFSPKVQFSVIQFSWRNRLLSRGKPPPSEIGFFLLFCYFCLLSPTFTPGSLFPLLRCLACIFPPYFFFSEICPPAVLVFLFRQSFR